MRLLLLLSFLLGGGELKSNQSEVSWDSLDQATQVRYFEHWDIPTGKPKKEIPPDKVGDKVGGKRPYYRVTYVDSSRIKTVEYYRKKNQLYWTYFIHEDAQKKETTVSLVFVVQEPITVLDPHLFHPSLSEMKPGWVAKFVYDDKKQLREVSVRDSAGSVYYFYRFSYRTRKMSDGDTPGKVYITSSEYFKADSSRLGRHNLIFKEGDRLWKKEFFNASGKLTETIEYLYNPARKEVTIVIRDPKGHILHQQVVKRGR